MENKFKFDVADVKVTIHTTKRMYDVSRSLISVGTGKKLSSVAGVFDLSFAPTPLDRHGSLISDRMDFTSSDIYQNQWMKAFRENDLVLISFTKNTKGMPNYTMSGLIGRIHRVRKIETNGKVMHTINITGSDAGKILDRNSASLISNVKVDWSETRKTAVRQDSIRTIFALPGLASRDKLLAEVSGKVGVEKAIKSVMDTYQGLYSGIRWSKDNGRNYMLMSEMINYEEKVREYAGEIVQGFNVAASQGSLSSIIAQIAERPFYEFFVDSNFVFPGEAYLIVRPTPFSNIKQNTLYDDKSNYHTIVSGDIIMEDTSKTDNEAFTAFRVAPALPGMGKGDVHVFLPTKVVGKLLERYGFKLLDVTSRHLFIEQDKYVNDYSRQKDGTETARKKRNELIEWYYYNDLHQSGSIIINGNDKIRIGEYLWRDLKDDDYFVYYIEEVNQKWSFGQQWITTLGVTRGLYVAEYAKYYPGLLFQKNRNEVSGNLRVGRKLAG